MASMWDWQPSTAMSVCKSWLAEAGMLALFRYALPRVTAWICGKMVVVYSIQ